MKFWVRKSCIIVVGKGGTVIGNTNKSKKYIHMTMKQLTWRLILPLTIISFGVFTKWWYVLPVDAPDTMMAGFPLAFVCDGWHTSMSLQIFAFELMFDFLIYFSFWFLLIIFINRYLLRIKIDNMLLTDG